METRSGYKPDHKSMARLLLSDQTLKPCLELAEKIRAEAQATAPRSKGPGPHMADEYKVKKGDRITVAGNPRVTAEVYNENGVAVAREFGNSRTPNPERPLGKAAAKHSTDIGVSPSGHLELK